MLEVKDLIKVYENGLAALKGVSFTAPDSGLLAIVGPSGCGKSTLLNVLAGNDTKTSGTIILNGAAMEHNTQKLRYFASVFQDYKLIENITVTENLMIAKELANSDISDNEIFELLERIGIADCADSKVFSLSGGQKQRTAIARAMVKQPKIIFADEPTGNLDSENSDNIFRLFKELSKDILIVLVTHDTVMAEQYADRIIKLADGQILSDNAIESNITSADITERIPKIVNKIKPHRAGLSAKSSWALALAFNKAKKGRRLAFMIISVIIIMFTTLSVNWSLISYNQMTYSTYSKHKNSELLQVEYETRLYDQTATSNITIDQYLDLKPFANRINEEKNIKSAKVYPVHSVNKMSQGNYSQGRVDKNLKPISMYDYYSCAEVKQIALTDNVTDLGIQIIEGRAPLRLGEIAVPKGMKTYVEACGGVYDGKRGEWVSLEGNEFFEYDFEGVRIVGVFEDNLKLDSKFKNYSAVFTDQGEFAKAESKKYFDEMESEAASILNGNYLSSTVIVSTATDAFYRDTAYYSNNGIEQLEGEYVNLWLKAGDFSTTNLHFLPANANTERLTGVSNLEKGVVLIDKEYAETYSINEGDTVNFESKLIRGNVHSLNNLAFEKNIANKDFRVKFYDAKNYSSAFIFSDDDFNILTDNFNRETSFLLLNSKGLTKSDFDYLSRTAIDVFGDKHKEFSGEQAFLTFNGDYLGDVLNDYNSLESIRDYVMIALSIVLVIFLLIFGYNITSIIITGKANDLLILKSLGAKKKDYFKIYGIFTSLQLALELLVGIALGALLLFGVNFLLTDLILGSYTVALPIIGWEILITALIVIASSALALAVNIGKINDKNLRKAFQKTKD